MSTQTLPMKPIEMIAQGLQGVVHEAADTAARRVREEIREEFGPRFDRVDARLDRQDETLRMVWKQVRGNGKLPIDDPPP